MILSGEFDLEPDDPAQLTKRMQKQWIIKKAGQPLSHQNVACVFEVSAGMSAGMLVEQAGLKGTRVGAVEVSQRHANFIAAGEGASSQDVLRLRPHPQPGGRTPGRRAGNRAGDFGSGPAAAPAR